MVSGTPEKELATYTSSLTPVTRGPSTHTHTQHTHTDFNSSLINQWRLPSRPS